MTEAALPRILCVDDEVYVLDGITRVLHRKFEVVTANGGAAGIAILQSDRRFDVIISDMRMPKVDGVAMLSAARRLAPDSTRILLTGQADIRAAVGAINEGQIFRFLTKPCPPEQLIATLTQAAEQHRLVTAERQILEQTLRGSVQALVEVLSLADPNSFGVATRARRLIGELAALIGFRDQWQMEMAAMLSQIGAITLPPELAKRCASGAPLTPAETERIAELPEAALRILGTLPRLEEIRLILAHAADRYDGGRRHQAHSGDQIPLGARMLRAVLDFDLLRTQGFPAPAALARLQARTGYYDPAVLSDLATVIGAESGQEICELTFQDVRLGMVFVDDVRTQDGTLLVARGQETTLSLLDRIQSYWADLELPGPVRVTICATESSAVA